MTNTSLGKSSAPYRSSRSASAIRRASHRPGRFPHASVGLLLWLMFVWVLLWGDPTTGNFLAGMIVALVVTTVASFPATPFDGRFRPWAVVRLVIRLLWDIVHSSFQQGMFIVRGKKPRGAIIRVHVRSHSDVYLAMISGMTALVPGSVVVEAHRVTGTLYVHVFDTGLAGGITGVHRTILALEERIMRAFASHDELVDAGYVPGSSPRLGRLPTPYAPATGAPREKLSDTSVRSPVAYRHSRLEAEKHEAATGRRPAGDCP
ncbi:Na+/H+ antiporter subunit E [Trueperella sp. LYQ143]|uniref:Na+/H+ antiporter subunit E n=1 Tax=Trueperella sp. LYQ143 TaxID=3391059 RepID=UPI003983BBC1